MPADPTRDDWRRLRAENRLARERLESARLTAATRHQERRGRLLESLSLDWVTPYADLLDRFRSASDPILAGPSSAWQRRQGRNYPIYQTEQELNLLRAPARLLVATSGYAQGLLSGLTSYVIGSGYTYRVAKKTRESEAPDELVREVQRVVDDFLRRNQWYGGEQPGMEEELFERSVEDGEFALVDTPNEDGTTDVRTAEPEQITAPPPGELEDDEDGLFGVITPKDDVQNVLAYWVQWGDSPHDGERVPADRLTHFRRNVRRSMKRGITDFCFDTLDALSLAATLRTNLGDGAAQQAAIVMVRQHATGSASDIEAFNDGQAEFTKRDPLTGTEQRYRKMRRGGHEDIPEGMQYVAGPGAQNAPAHLSILQGLLRSAGVKWNAPEWLASGDASNNNYSSSLTAESPFVRTVTRRQRGYREAFRRPVWAAAEHHVRTRGITAAGRAWTWEEVCREIDLLVEAPSPETRNRLTEAQQAQIDIPLGADSRQQYAQRQGRDFDQIEADNQAWEDKHGSPGGPLPLPGDPDADGLPGTTPPPKGDAEAVTESLIEGAGPHKFGCAMVMLDGPAAAALLALAARVADADLAGDGRESEPHVTVRYGLHTDDARGVAALLADAAPVQMRLGAVTLFPGDVGGKDYDVIKADVEGDDIQRLHAKLGALPHTDTHSDYKPHATIAYVKAGLGAKYAAEFGRIDQAATVGRVVYSSADGLRTTIPLRGVGMIESVEEETYQTLVGIGRWLTEDVSGGLVPRQVQITNRRTGKTYKRTVMVRPDEGGGGSARPATAPHTDGPPRDHVLAGLADVVKAADPAVAANPSLMARLADKALTAAAKAHIALTKLTPAMLKATSVMEGIFDTPDDMKSKFGYNPSSLGTHHDMADPVKSATGVSAHLAGQIAAHVLARGLVYVKQRLAGARHESDGGDVYDALGAVVHEAVAAVAAEFGLAAPPEAVDIAASLRSMADADRAESVSEDTFAAMAESGAWLAEEIDAEGRTVMEAGAGLVPKKVTVHKKSGGTFQRTVMVRVDAPPAAQPAATLKPGDQKDEPPKADAPGTATGGARAKADPTDWQTPDWQHAPTGKSQNRYVNRYTGKVAYAKSPPKGRTEGERRAAVDARAERLKEPARLTPGFEKSAEDAAGAVGLSVEAFPALMGGQPGTVARVTKGSQGGVAFVTLDHPDTTDWSRVVSAQPDGSVEVYNAIFFLRPNAQGDGFGTKAFAGQIAAAVEHGVARVRTTAGRGTLDGVPMNGYATWPRLGYDAPLTDGQRKRLPAGLKGAKTVLDLYESKEGRDWWRENGTTTSMTFDVSPGSKSLKVLNAYLASKGQPTIEYTPEQAAANKDRQAARVAAAKKKGEDELNRLRQANLDYAHDRGAIAAHRAGYDHNEIRRAAEANVARVYDPNGTMPPGEKLSFAYTLALNEAGVKRLDARLASDDGKAIGARYEVYAREAGIDPAAIHAEARRVGSMDSGILDSTDAAFVVRQVYMKALAKLENARAAT